MHKAFMMLAQTVTKVGCFVRLRLSSHCVEASRTHTLKDKCLDWFPSDLCLTVIQIYDMDPEIHQHKLKSYLTMSCMSCCLGPSNIPPCLPSCSYLCLQGVQRHIKAHSRKDLRQAIVKWNVVGFATRIPIIAVPEQIKFCPVAKKNSKFWFKLLKKQHIFYICLSYKECL